MADDGKIRLFLCTCHGEIDYPPGLGSDPDVQVVTHDHLCGEEGYAMVWEAGGDVIIAGCTERIAGQFFPGASTVFVNVREQGSFAGASPEKIGDLVRGALARSKIKDPCERKTFHIEHKAVLVIGAGVAGLEAARQIAENDLKVYLVEREPFVGGLVSKLDRLYPEGTPNAHTLNPLIDTVLRAGDVDIITGARVTGVDGELGNYRVNVSRTNCLIDEELATGRRCEAVCPVEVAEDGVTRKAVYYRPTYPHHYAIDAAACTSCGKCKEIAPSITLDFTEEERVLEVGAIVVATGFKPYDIGKLTAMGYGKHPGVLTPLEFERKVTAEEIDPQRVAIINCAGSRDEHHLPYCSQVCCLLGLKEAKLIKDRNPDAEVSVFYIDMRSYGELESLYTALRENYRVAFIQGKPAEVIVGAKEVTVGAQEVTVGAQKVTVGDGHLTVRAEDVQLGETVEVEADCVVLAHGYRPDCETFDLLGIASGECASGERAFPSHYIAASRSPDSNPRGIFICGGAAFPKNVLETVAEARNTAAEVIHVMSSEMRETTLTIPAINSSVCAELGCRICVSTCPYEAIQVVDEELKVNPSICMGCGTCTATCPAGANQMQGETSRRLLAQVKVLSKPDTIIAFLCRWSAYPAADLAGYDQVEYPNSARIIRVPCTGRVGGELIMQAFAGGAKGVLIGGCYPGSCHYVSGNLKARRREHGLEQMIEQLGLGANTLRLEWFGTNESKKLARVLKEMAEDQA